MAFAHRQILGEKGIAEARAIQEMNNGKRESGNHAG
jgi:hypothetical protein